VVIAVTETARGRRVTNNNQNYPQTCNRSNAVSIKEYLKQLILQSLIE